MAAPHYGAHGCTCDGGMGQNRVFGAVIRKRRLEKEIGLREMARQIGVSPTYLSQVERDEFEPPTERRIRDIAGVLDLDPDDLLALTGRIPEEIAEIIREHPKELTVLLRSTKGMTAEDIERLAKKAGRKRKG